MNLELTRNRGTPVALIRKSKSIVPYVESENNTKMKIENISITDNEQQVIANSGYETNLGKPTIVEPLY